MHSPWWNETDGKAYLRRLRRQAQGRVMRRGALLLRHERVKRTLLRLGVERAGVWARNSDRMPRGYSVLHFWRLDTMQGVGATRYWRSCGVTTPEVIDRDAVMVRRGTTVCVRCLKGVLNGDL